MKLRRGQILTISELTGYGVQFIHMVLNGERSKESLGAKKIYKVIEILEEEHVVTKEKIKKALIELEEEFKNNNK